MNCSLGQGLMRRAGPVWAKVVDAMKRRSAIRIGAKEAFTDMGGSIDLSVGKARPTRPWHTAHGSSSEITSRRLRQREIFELEGDDEEFGFGGDVPDQFGGFGGRVLGGSGFEGEEIGPVFAAAAAGKIDGEGAAVVIEQSYGAADGFELIGQAGGNQAAERALAANAEGVAFVAAGEAFDGNARAGDDASGVLHGHDLRELPGFELSSDEELCRAAEAGDALACAVGVMELGSQTPLPWAAIVGGFGHIFLLLGRKERIAALIDGFFELGVAGILQNEQFWIAIGGELKREAVLKLIGLGQIDLVVALDAFGDDQERAVDRGGTIAPARGQ